MGKQDKSRKITFTHRRFGGDELVDKNGISTENHMEIYKRLIKDGPRMHGTPGERKHKQ